MTVTRLNHASIVAHDLEESVSFYEEVLGLERLPTPNFEVPVAWMSCGDGQLHLFERDVPAPDYHHFGLTVDDFEFVYDQAEKRSLFASWDAEIDEPLFVLPDGAVQLYLSDPVGNLVEVDWPDVETLPAEIKAKIVDRRDLDEQLGDVADASLELRPLER